MNAEPSASAGSVRLRPAKEEDGERVLSWANDPATRRASFHSAPIAPEQHQRWFSSVLRDPHRTLLIAEYAGSAIAVVRLDRGSGASAELSLNLAPERRGRRLSAPVLAAAVEHARALGLTTLVARIRPENGKSLRTFTGAGFRLAGREVVAGQDALRYELRLDDG